jgi:hypothetical protein
LAGSDKYAAPARMRGALSGLNQLMISCGILVAYLINLGFDGTGQWRYSFGLALAPAIPLAGVGVAFLQQMIGIDTVIYYAPSILKVLGFADSAALIANAGLGALTVVITVIMILVVDKVGRRSRQPWSDRPRWVDRFPPPWAANSLRPGWRSKTPEKIRWLRAIMCSSGWPMMLDRYHLSSRALRLQMWGCRNIGAPSSSARAHKTSTPGWERSMMPFAEGGERGDLDAFESAVSTA